MLLMLTRFLCFNSIRFKGTCDREGAIYKMKAVTLGDCGYFICIQPSCPLFLEEFLEFDYWDA